MHAEGHVCLSMLLVMLARLPASLEGCLLSCLQAGMATAPASPPRPIQPPPWCAAARVRVVLYNDPGQKQGGSGASTTAYVDGRSAWPLAQI